ncbi:phage terminase large subunit family protein [Hahella sp. KA22]|uniref:phage terminase large subunit family protein n=3 Tax=Gammaproteobacteria TaxID=1236 RepID=UPI000FDDEDAE|nr:phage terminase large subunit family protein [Hahella sp. KA22]AZZ92756.1 phage terminase large subunit family protein [Hahella sp. KA22]QAY56130.1 phage terminase large subunit family protein [Hahella sp. KA22]
MTTKDWANKYRWLAKEQSARPGKYNSRLTPWIEGIMDAVDDPRVKKLVVKKSAQVAYTDGFWNNYLGRRIHTDPCPIVLLFPKEKTIKKYLDQKFNPMITATPVLRDLVDVTTSRKAGNRQDQKNFPGGFLSLVASNAPDNVKSTSAPVVAVEEPDDCNTNVFGQGDSIKLLEERAKTYDRRKVIFGGTPTVKGVSRVDESYKNSDQRKFYIPCHECGESHVLSWDNIRWDEDESRSHEVFGKIIPESAFYVCPHCTCVWNDNQKNRNVKNGVWVAEADFSGTAGFYINELYAPFPGSRFANLLTKYLEAKHKKEQGDDGDMIVFVNSTLGLSYEYETDSANEDELEAKALEYPEKSIPVGGLILTMGVDVQHDRLAVIIRAWGRGEESFLVYWGELAAQTACTDKNDAVWKELDTVLFGVYEHASGAGLRISATGIDSSDGATNDAVYHYVRSRKKLGAKIMAIKGDSENTKQASDREIVTPPRKVDVNSQTKASKYGLQVYIVGTQKAKDLISARLKLSGIGPGRMHNYKDVRSDYYAQVLSEIKAPSRRQLGKKVWQKKAGVRNEALDCEVYALHAARVLRIQLKKPADWDNIEANLKQVDLLSPITIPTQPDEKPSAGVSVKHAGESKSGGWGSLGQRAT